MGLCCWMRICRAWKRLRHSPRLTSTSALELSICHRQQILLEFSYSELAQATNYYNELALLGVGGAGKVYKGTLPDGRAVAVKVLSAATRTVDHGFFNELDLVSRVFHRNLVRLLGYCSDEDSLALVYEFMPRGDLGQYLYGQRQSMVLTWAQRYNIACGVAAALEYLHYGVSPMILHRDVKPSNILLDDGYDAHLSDFGIALLQAKKDEDSASVLMGSIEYMDLEYVFTLRLGPEIDVYSFGVVLLQLVSGRRFLEDDIKITVIQYVWVFYKEGRLLDAVDERLKVDGHHDDEDKMSHLLLLGLMCCQSKAKDRPTMREVVQILSGEWEPYLAHDREIL